MFASLQSKSSCETPRKPRANEFFYTAVTMAESANCFRRFPIRRDPDLTDNNVARSQKEFMTVRDSSILIAAQSTRR